jgi:DNA repair ATPase RecN
MKDRIKLPDGRIAMNLFELMDAIDSINERVKDVEKLSHEPQNYKEKCDEMETRINKVERRLKKLSISKKNDTK